MDHYATEVVFLHTFKVTVLSALFAMTMTSVLLASLAHPTLTTKLTL